MILLQVGQCGIQVGQTIVKQLEHEYPSSKQRSSLCQLDQIVVDTEKKVRCFTKMALTVMGYMQTWSQVLKSGDVNSKGSTTIVDCGSTGRGNNWAYGYWDDQGLVATLEAVRITLERSDEISPGCMLVHSVAGGTGSGLGSSVLPFSSGETALQHYNSILSLGWIQNLSDLSFLFANDSTMASVSKQYDFHSLRRGGKSTGSSFNSTKKPEDRVTLHDLNDYIAQCVAGVLLPTTPARQISPGELEHEKPRRFDGLDLINTLVPTPSCKIATISSSHIVPGADPSFGSWKFARFLRARLLVRGGIGPEFWSHKGRSPATPSTVSTIENKVKTKLGVYTGYDNGLDLSVSSCYTTDLRSKNRSLVLCANTSDAFHTIEPVLAKSRSMRDAGAYIHWYRRHWKTKTGSGWDVDALFDEGFESVQNMLDAYQKHM
ncbi:hypothetical protein HDU67_006097 [Dinochytrium kinnereticum]|nr:hypothetical protein HDU67_006097 [Dinochytrium kinnereticum]